MAPNAGWVDCVPAAGAGSRVAGGELEDGTELELPDDDETSGLYAGEALGRYDGEDPTLLYAGAALGRYCAELELLYELVLGVSDTLAGGALGAAGGR